jgi:hypothetical protein
MRPGRKASPKKSPNPFRLGTCCPSIDHGQHAKKTYATAEELGRQALKEMEKSIADPAHLKQLGRAIQLYAHRFRFGAFKIHDHEFRSQQRL